MDIGRFAPTTSGRAHPGTLLSGLLAWLDIRSRGGRLVLRFENIDPAAQSPHLTSGLLDDLSWFGLDWDELVAQSDCLKTHHAALDRLIELDNNHCRAAKAICNSSTLALLFRAH